MRTNVFLRSMRRQPAKAAVMLLVVGVITFAFVARAAEYLLVQQETERLSGYYTSVGSLESTAGDNWADREGAAAFLAQHPDVELVSRYRNVSAVLPEDCKNADTDMTLTSGTTGYLAFYGTLFKKSPNYLSFIVDTPLTGYPEYTRKGRLVILMRNGLDYGEEAFEALEEDGRFFVVGFYDASDHNCMSTDDGLFLQLVPVTDDMFFYPVAEGEEVNFDDPALAYWKDMIPFVQEQQRTVNALAVEDMSALPDVQEEGRRIYLTGGRWLDSADTREGKKTCVIHNGFASLRGLKIGDTLTLKLRDVPSYFGYCLAQGGMDEMLALWRECGERTETETFEIVGTYEYTDGTRFNSTIVRNNLYIPASAVPEDFVCANGSGVDPELYRTMSYWAFSVDRGYQSEEGPYPGEAAFLLKDPAAEKAFLEDTQGALEAMGFRAAMVENGWDNFQAAAVPMGRSSLYNAMIFTVLLVMTLTLVAFAYFYMRRKELAVVRAMGVPVKRCVAEISLPLLIIGFAGLLPGAFLGWRYAGENAAETLESLAAFGSDGSAALPGGYLAALCGAAAVLLVAVTLTFARVRAGLPVLGQIQGGAPAGTQKKAPAKEAAASAAPAPAKAAPAPVRMEAVRTVPPVAAPAGKGSGGAGVMLRFVWRYMTRAKAKSLLTAVLAAAFTVGLAAIALAIENNTQEIEELYETIAVRVELTKKDSTSVTVKGGGFLFEETVQSVLDTGYITDAYLEGANAGTLYTYEDIWDSGEGFSISSLGSACNILAIDDVEKFLSTIGSGSTWTITYTEGWDESCFGKDWREAGQSLENEDDRLPVLLPRVYYDEYLAEDGRPIVLTCKGQHRVCTVAGVYDGAESGNYRVTPLILMPQSALQAMVGNRMRYSAASFTVDPAMNHDLDAFRDAIDALANTPRIGGVRVRVMLRDEELRQAAEPLEESVELMELLYPVMLVLSVLVAAAGSALFVMLSAKEAAILRVQGTGKVRVQIMLSLQQVFTCLAGLAVGLAGMMVYLVGRQPELTGTILGGALLCAVLYLAAATAGAVGASMVVTGKNPLEMLQVKE